MEERRLSLKEAQAELGVSERTIHRWIKSGKLKSYKPGRDHQIPESAIRKVIEESEVYPKVQASLWPEEEPERRTEVDAWATYVLRRASRIGEHAEDPDSPVFRDARTAMFFIEETHRESTNLIRTISEHAPGASLPFDGAPLDGLLDAFKELGIATGQAEAIARVMKAATPEDVVAQRRAAKAAKENEEEMERLSEVLNRHAS